VAPGGWAGELAAEKRSDLQSRAAARDGQRPDVYIARVSAPVVDNKVAVLILQHPQEQDRVLGTARLLAENLAQATLTIGLSWRNLSHALKQPAEAKDWGVLYLGSTHAAKAKGPLVALDRTGEPLADQTAGRAGLKGIVVLDGNWSQAKALWWRNPWLTKLRRFVVVPDAPSLYGDLRREARPDAVSTLEAVALALAVLETDAAVRDKLLMPFRELLAKARAAGIRDTKRDRRVRR
jgi:DTW domain-containing protein YfiP